MNAPVIEVVRVPAGPTFLEAQVVSELRPQAEGILALFAQHASELADGFSLWVGWGPLTVRASAGGFTVEAPDYATDPRASTTSDLSLVIWLIVGMQAITTGSDVAPEEVSYTDDVIVTRGALEAPMLVMSRTAERSPGDSGWFVEPFPQSADRDWTPSDLERMPAWRVLQSRREVARALALPSGYSVIVQPDAIRAVVREADNAVVLSGPA